jgi:Ca2+-binding EF-hand superfamily protein
MSELALFDITDFYTLQQLQQITLEELEAKPTLVESYIADEDLKIFGMLIQPSRYPHDVDLNQFMLWLSRTSTKDGKAKKVTLEIFDKDRDGKVILQKWQVPRK